MSGGDIFYSQVDANLQLELNARGKAGFSSKTNKDLQFMLEKIANVYITPYTDETKTKEIANASLGGAAMRGGEYMPTGKNGYLSDRSIIQKTRTINAKGTGFDEASPTPISNISRRIPPFITACEINIADNSNGLLNTATVNITIPNPERDLNFIESVYFRPGRNCTIIIEHPTTALVAIDKHNGLLTSGSNPTATALRDLYKMDPKDYLDQYGQLNSKRFDGVITTFTMQYETDMSVTSTIELRGGATQINELSLITADESKKKSPDGIGNNPGEQTAEQKAAMAAKLEADKKEREANEKGETTNPIFKDFYQNLKTKVNADLASKEEVPDGLISAPTITTPCEPQTYIALYYLIDYINTIIDAKLKSTTNKTPNKSIVCNEICTSTYFKDLYSVDPQRILIPTTKIYVESIDKPGAYRHENGWQHVLYTELDSKGETSTKYTGDILSSKNIKINDEKIATSQIYVNLKVIEERFKSGNKQSAFSIETFLAGISSEIHAASAGAIDLQLITPAEPDLRDKDKLLYYDTNIGIPTGPPVIPYSVPMFSNHPYGTVIREFSFSGKLPSDASSLAYAVSINPKEISEKDIAPFLSYMYSNNTVERGDGTETVGTMITQQQLNDIIKAYRETHELAITELAKATKNFLADPTNMVKRGLMAVAMRKYLQYPKPTIQESNQQKAPIIPFDASFTIDGINGFKYGDVLSFAGLPKRYQENCVFLVVGQTDSVATDGQWTTAIRCLMRPKI